jgi:arginine N-succinyltransferase
MSTSTPAFLIREATPRDHRQILRLARELDSINLPTDSRELSDLLARSALSFRGRIRDRTRSVYVFCAQRAAGAQLVGASMIIGKHGTPTAPHYYLQMDSDERYSHRLRRMFRHTYLRLRYSMDGPTELAGLIVSRRWRHRRERVGKQLSWVRFLYIARHRARFERRVLAEMLPPSGPDHSNPFWDHYGRAVTGLTFREADRLSIHDKEFIRTLFPDSPLYTFLLPADVRESLGAVGENSRGAVRLLEQAGMRFLHHIDPFDAGPYYGAAVEDLVPVHEYRSLRARAGDPSAMDAQRWMLAIEGRRGFRAVAADGVFDGERIVVANEVLKMLGASSGERVSAVPLP